MPSQFFGLNIAGSGLSSYQSAINTTANNISNVQTEGYSKQVNNRQAADAIRVHQRYGSAGSGVVTTSISQLRNQYYDEKYWENQSNVGYYDNQYYYMSQIETYFTDDDKTTGFSSLLSKMFNALDSVGSSAADETVRKSFISSSQSLASYFNNIGTELQSLQSSINDEIKTTVDNINAISEKISLLNKQINAIEISGGYANELRDQRALLIDEISEIIPVEVTETQVQNSNYPDMQTPATNYTVKINGQTLVDGNDYRTITATARDHKQNQSDVEGLYDLTWTDTGTEFNASSAAMNGKLKSMFEMRDGNNAQVYSGKMTAYDTSSNIVTFSDGVSSVDELNIPTSGTITVNNRSYTYNGFSYETSVDEDGNEVIEAVHFNLDKTLSTDEQGQLTKVVGIETGTVGKSIDAMGVPYYMNQMSSFLRSFCQKFNTIEESGVDLNGNDMGAFFTAEIASGEVDFSTYSTYNEAYEKLVVEYKEQNPDATDADARAYASTQQGNRTYHVGTTDTSGNTVYDGTYYLLTALSFSVAKESVKDPSRFSTTKSIADGVEAAELVDSLQKLYDDATIYRGCVGKDFLQCILDDVSVDTEEAKTFQSNYTSIQSAIDTQRKSISGVDEDEEALDLIKFQNAYNLSAKVISVLTEMYDQLILNTGV